MDWIQDFIVNQGLNEAKIYKNLEVRKYKKKRMAIGKNLVQGEDTKHTIMEIKIITCLTKKRRKQIEGQLTSKHLCCRCRCCRCCLCPCVESPMR